MRSVSVAMATYNGHAHIKRQLESLVAQSHMPSEIVITDDGSSDDTLSIISKFAETAPVPVLTYRNDTRLGFRGNFMRAANLCRSELIAFCDQDDVWYDRKIKVCVERFDDPDVLLVYHNADVVTDDGKYLGSLREFAASGPLIAPMSFNPMAPVPGFTQVFRRQMLQYFHMWATSQDHRYKSEPMAHDQWFYFLAAILGKIGYLNEPLAAYVQHGRNTYGYSGRANHLAKIRLGLQGSVDQLSRLATAADSRALILETIKPKLDGMQRERAETAARHYRRLSELNTIRRRIYASAGFSERANAFINLLKSRGYGGTWNLSRKALIKDICVGVPFGEFGSRSA